FDHYNSIIDELLAANTKVALAINDPDLRRGADLSQMSTRELDVIARLVKTMLNAEFTQGNLKDRSVLLEAGSLYGLAKNGQDDLLRRATGEYKAAADRMDAYNRSHPFMEDVAPKVLSTGIIPVDKILQVVSVPNDESYYGFRTRVKDTLDN